jgi:hypothetical protein
VSNISAADMTGAQETLRAYLAVLFGLPDEMVISETVLGQSGITTSTFTVWYGAQNWFKGREGGG